MNLIMATGMISRLLFLSKFNMDIVFVYRLISSAVCIILFSTSVFYLLFKTCLISSILRSSFLLLMCLLTVSIVSYFEIINSSSYDSYNRLLVLTFFISGSLTFSVFNKFKSSVDDSLISPSIANDS